MADIRMPDGTVIRGVPDGVGRDDFNAHLIEKYGQEKFDSMTTGAAQREPSPAIVDPDPEPTPEPTPQEQEDTAAKSFVKAASTRRHGILGSGVFPRDKEEAIEQEMAVRKRVVDLGIYPADRYKQTAEEFDRMSGDRIQAAILEKQNAQAPAEDKKNIADILGERTGFEQTPPDELTTPKKTEREISEDAGWWRFAAESTKSIPPLVVTGIEGISRMHDRLEAQNLSMGMVYLDRITSDYENVELGEDAEGLAEDAAAKHGLTVEEYSRYVASAVDVAFDSERDSLEEFSAIMKEVQSFKPESAEDTFIGHIGALAIENIQNVAYIAAGVITMNPITTMALMGTDIYARTYMGARLDGRSADDATMDAFASAIIEGVTEGVPVGKFIKLMKSGNTGRAMKLLQGVGTETGQELLAELAQIGYDMKIIGDDMTFGEAFIRVRDAGILGGLMGTAIGGPVAILGDNDMSNANTLIHEAKKTLQSVANRMTDPAEKGTTAGKEEVDAAVKDYADAVNAKRDLILKREEAEAEKKKAKTEKKETKRKAKRSPREVEKEEKFEKARKADQTVDKLTPEIKDEASLIESVIAGEEISQKAAQGLVDKAYAKVTKRGNLVVLPAGNRRLKAVKQAQKKAEAAVEPAPKPKIRPKVPALPEVAVPVEGELIEGEGEVEVATKNLAKMDKKTKGTKVGRALREAEKKLRKEADEALSKFTKSKPEQGTLFDIGGALVEGSKDYANLVKYGAFKLAQHGAKYSAWAADMVGEFGDSIRPILKRLYNDAKRNVKNVLGWAHERFDSGPRKGELKHAPKKYAKPGAIAGLRRVISKLAAEGATGRMWYEKSGEAINKVTGNQEEARLLAGIMAIYSTGTGVGPNLTNALKMWAIYQSGNIPRTGAGTMAGRFSRQDLAAIKWLKGQTDADLEATGGPKVFPFFSNLMRQIDPETYEFGQGVTVDLWIMRALGYDTTVPTDAQNAFGAVELKALADKLGWEKQQLQAAVWVSIKARWGIITDRAQARAIKQGLAEKNRAKKGWTFDVLGEARKDQIENEKKIAMIFREEALKVSVDELSAALNRSKKDFSDYLETQYATVSWESDPSTSLGLVFNSMPIEDKILLQYEISQVLTNPETGREYIAEWLGLIGADQFQGPGAWDGAVGAATQNQVLAPPKHKGSLDKTKAVQAQSASALNGYVAILGFLLKQDAVAWHRPFYGNAKKRANGVGIIMPRNMDAAKLRRSTIKLYSAIVAESVEQGFGEDTGRRWAPIVFDGEIRILNFEGDFVGNRVFHKIIKAAAEKSGVGGAHELFQYDGNLIENNWEENPNGENYEQAISNNENKRVGKAFERAKRELAKRIDAVYEKYAEKYAAGKSADITVTRLAEGQKAPKLKKGRMRFRHFGRAAVGALKLEFFGTGIKGAEKKRGSMRVISAYPDKGFKKEVGLGNVEYVIDVRAEDLYDANNDPSGFKAKATVPTGEQGGKPIGGRLDFNKLESLIKGAGFVGYYTPKADGILRGQARFFHDLTVGEASLSATFMTPSKPTIQIVDNAETDQIEVRDKDGKVNFIDDPDAAIEKARSIYGEDLIVEIVDEAGDVIVTDYPKPKKTTLKEKLAEGEALADIYLAIDEFMAEFNEETTEHPISSLRILGDGPSIEVSSRGGSIWIDYIRAYEKGAGQGNAALKFLIDLADKHGVQMRLYAKAYGESSMDDQALIDWYERNGFTAADTPYKGGLTMVREPQNVSGAFVAYKRPRIMLEEVVSEQEANEIIDEFKLELGIENIELVDEMPEELQPQVAMLAKKGIRVAAAFHNDAIKGPTIFIVRRYISGIDGPGGLIEQLLHETIGHFGLQALLGWRKYNQIMDAIIKAYPVKVAFRGKTLGSGLQSRRLAAEEVFAYWAQDEYLGKDLSAKEKGFIQRVIAEIRLMLVRLGTRLNLKYDWAKMTDERMLDLMRQSLRFVHNNTTATLKKRSAAVSTRRVDAIKREGLRSSRGLQLPDLDLTPSLKEDDPLLRSFDDKTGNRKGSMLENLREWRARVGGGIAQRLEQKLIDEFSGIKHMEKELGIERGGYMSVRLSAGVDVIIRSALDNAVPTWHIEEDGSASVKMDDTVKGLTEILSRIDSSVLLRNFQRFLVANRSRRLIKEGKEKLVSREEIAAVLKDVRKQGQYKLFVEVQKELDTYKGKILDFAQEAGLIDPVSRKLWEKHDHIPFYRVLAKNDKNGAFAKLGSVGKVIHYQKGSTAELKPALENIFDNISMLIEAAVKNRAMADVINQFKDSGVVTKVPRMEIDTALVPMDQVKKMLEEAGVELGEEGEELLSGVQKLLSVKQRQEKDNVVSMQVNGKKEFYYVHDEGVMGGMESVGTKNYGWVMKILRAPKRMITLIITRFPGFVFANWFRDMMHSFVLIRYGQHTPWDSIEGWGEAMWESQTFKELMAGGGMFDSGYINTSDPATTARAIKRKLMKPGRGNILDSPAKLARLYLRFTNGAENAARISIFKKALRKTGSRKQALYEARDIMDFSVRGSSPILQFFIETVPFLGARIQGLARTGRGFRENPMLVGSRGLVLVLATLALYLNNRDREKYKSLLDYDKHMYYHFFDVFEPGDHYRLPKPFEVGAMFSTIPEIGFDYLLSQEPDKGAAAADSLLWVLMEQFNLKPAVQLVTPIYELAINENLFTEAPIENYWETQLDANRRYNDRTNKTIIWLARNMPEDAPDFMRSPKQLEFLIKRYFSTAADYTLGISDRMFFSEGRPTPRMDEQFPVVSRFKREPFPKFDKYQESMYDVLDRAETIWQTILDLKKDKTPESNKRWREIRDNHKALLYARKRLTPTYKRIQLINKKITRVHAHKSMTPDQKREQLDRLIDQKRKLAERIYKFRPGGGGNPYGEQGGEAIMTVPTWVDDLIGKNKRGQVDVLIDAKMPHAATLINDVTIGLTKLKDAA